MEPIFKNMYVYTIENMTETAKYSLRKIYKVILIIVAVMWAIVAGLNILFIGFTAQDIIMLAAGLFFLFWVAYLPRVAAKKAYKRNMVLYKAQPSIVVDFFDDRLELQNEISEEHFSFSYDQIIKIKNTKNLYLFTLPQRIIIIVQKQSFVAGQLVDFVPFLKQKCPRAAKKL